MTASHLILWPLAPWLPYRNRMALGFLFFKLLFHTSLRTAHSCSRMPHTNTATTTTTKARTQKDNRVGITVLGVRHGASLGGDISTCDVSHLRIPRPPRLRAVLLASCPRVLRYSSSWVTAMRRKEGREEGRPGAIPGRNKAASETKGMKRTPLLWAPINGTDPVFGFN